jgi:SLOG cluster2
VVEVTPARLPEELRPLEAQAIAAGRTSPTWRYLRARGLTHLRRRLVERCHARVALGGRLSGFDGRLPGIVEEVFLSCAAARPIYLAGLLGGAAEILGGLLVNGRPADDLRTVLERSEVQPLAEIYARHANPSAEGLSDHDLDLPAVAAFLAGDGSRAAIAGNGLIREDNLTLLTTDLEEQVIALVLLGLRRVAERTRRPGASPSATTGQAS